MKNPEVVKRVYEKRLKFKGQSSPEKHFINLIKQNNFPVRYVGNGSFWVVGKNPDFKIIGEKKLIEVTDWGYRNRGEDYAKERSDHFAKYGFKTLVVFYRPRPREIIMPLNDIKTFIFNGAEIVNIRKARKGKKIVWNLHCEPHNNYFVNGLLSHNCFLEDSSIPVKDKILAKNNDKYKGIWFSFNSQYSFSHKNYDIFEDINEEPKTLFIGV
jgi:hypothetical protein